MTAPSEITNQTEAPSETAMPEAVQELFRGNIRVLAVSCFENERPLRGLVGWLDWHFQGVVSKALRRGQITGSAGECVYVPVTRAGRDYHLILAGGGKVSATNPRPELPSSSFEKLKKNLISLKLGPVGLSRSDLGGLSEAKLKKEMKGVSLWIGT